MTVYPIVEYKFNIINRKVYTKNSNIFDIAVVSLENTIFSAGFELAN